MIVVDIEASGPDPRFHSLVSIGAVDFSKPERQFYKECRIWDGAKVMQEALAINGFTEAQITDPSKPPDAKILKQFIDWALEGEECTIAGQNPSTDRDFLRYTAERVHHVNWPFAYRIIDLHSIAFAHMVERGLNPPIEHKHSALNLDAILVYCGLPTELKPHNGLRGAQNEAEALSRLLYQKNLLPQFAQYKIPWLKV